jgi:hypothetical protein
MSEYTAPTNLGNALRVLDAWLLEACYTPHAREKVAEHIACHGTLEGLVYLGLLDREDEATAEQVFVENLSAIPQTGREWCDPVEWTLPDDELEALFAAAVEAECDRRDAPDPWPTVAEVAEYDAEHAEALARWLEQAEASRNFYRRNGSFGDWLDREGGPA